MSRKALNKIAERETKQFCRRQSLAFLDCAINLMSNDYTLEEVVTILREHADQIEELS